MTRFAAVVGAGKGEPAQQSHATVKWKTDLRSSFMDDVGSHINRGVLAPSSRPCRTRGAEEEASSVLWGSDSGWRTCNAVAGGSPKLMPSASAGSAELQQ